MLRMKTNHYCRLVAVVFGVAVFYLGGCAAKEQVAETPELSAKFVTSTTSATTTAAAPATAAVAIVWTDLQGLPYDMRAQLFTGLKHLETNVDGQFVELTAKRAAMKSTTDTKDWDFAMKEMADARTYLHSMIEGLNQASTETWNQQRDKVGQAWERVQAAYDKVKSSTTT
jgi:hypothetical protein